MSAKKASSDGKGSKDDTPEKVDAPEVSGEATAAGSDPDAPEVVMPEPGAPEATPEATPDVTLEAVEHSPKGVHLEAPEHSPKGVHLVAPEHSPRPADMPIGAPAGAAAIDPEPEETAPEPEPAPAATAPTPPPPAKSGGGFFPALLGGIIAAALGFGVAYLLFGNTVQDPTAKIEELEARQGEQATALDDLRGQVEAGPDLSALESRLEGMGSDIGALGDRIDVLAGDMGAAGDRITALEKRPVTDSVSEEAIAAYEAELDRLRQAMEDQREEVEALIEEARQMESDANATAEATMRRAALTRILSALESGAPYAAALADLQAAGQDVPEALAASAESGVPSMADLRASFPDAARLALSAARASDEGGKSFGDFLRDNLGARSLEPREGDDADAVLSRAEDALRANRLGDALAELETLPDPARAEMAGWIEQAETRRAAVAAAEELNAAISEG